MRLLRWASVLRPARALRRGGGNNAGLFRAMHFGAGQQRAVPSREMPLDSPSTDTSVVSKLLDILRCPSQAETELSLLGVRPTQSQISAVLKNALKQPQLGHAFLRWCRLQHWYVPDPCSFTMLIEAFGHQRDFEAVERLVQEMEQDRCAPTLATFNSLINVYGNAQRLEEMWGHYRRMREHGCRADNITFTTLMSAYSLAGQSEKVIQVYEEMESVGCKLDKLSYEYAIPHAGKLGDLDLADRLIERMQEEGFQANPVAYAAVIGGHLRAGKLEAGAGYYEQMRKAGMRPLMGTCVALVEAYCKSGKLETGMKFLEDLKMFRYKSNLTIYSAVVEAHCKAGFLDKALEFYEEMRSVGYWLPPTIFACLIEVHAVAGKLDAAMRLYREMRGVGLKPSQATCRIVIGAVSRGGKYEDVERLLFEMREIGHDPSDAINDSLVKLLDETRIGDARELFAKVTAQGFQPHIGLCREMLRAFLFHGDMEPAREMHSYMRANASTAAADLRTYCLFLEFFMKASREEDECQLMELLRETGHPAHRFLQEFLGNQQLRGQALFDYVAAFYKDLDAQADFKARRYFTNVILNYLVMMGQQEKARTLWKIVYQLKTYPNAIVLEGDLTWSLKIRYMSVGSAMVGVLCTLEKFRERILKRRYVPQRIKILTGPRDDAHSPAAKQAVEAMLEALDSPFLFQADELGSFWCRGSFFVRWFRQAQIRAVLRRHSTLDEEAGAGDDDDDGAHYQRVGSSSRLLLGAADDMPLPLPHTGDSVPVNDDTGRFRV